MRYKPHDYQTYATNFITDHPKSVLFLDMGLGKTVITLTALDELLYDSFQISKALIVAPLRVARDTWPEELAKWQHLQHLEHAIAVGDEKTRLAALAADKPITIINRENVDWLINKSGYKWDFDTLVIDELSSFKSPAAKRFKALKKVLPKTPRRIGLTGTPSPNGLLDLWAQYRLIDDGQRLGRFIGKYRGEYFTPDRRNQHMVFSYRLRKNADKQIYDQISDITLSMKALDHLKLAVLTKTTKKVNLTGKQLKVYERLKNELLVELDGEEITATTAVALSGKLTQAANGAVYTENRPAYKIVHEAKLDALEDLLEAANGQPVLVAYWFKHDLQRILERFPEAKEIKDSADIKAWNDGKLGIGLLHPASAGHGLNLQHGGHILIWFSLTWSLELYQQTNARLHRQGQTNPVIITHIVARGTIDERIMKALTDKNFTQAKLIEAVKAEIA